MLALLAAGLLRTRKLFRRVRPPVPALIHVVLFFLAAGTSLIQRKLTNSTSFLFNLLLAQTRMCGQGMPVF